MCSFFQFLKSELYLVCVTVSYMQVIMCVSIFGIELEDSLIILYCFLITAR